ncbi:phytoene dehydrogenase [Bacillus sp. FJAT-18017]|uniref:phytoene desaturase family protein n=1 Tax=Bacillus sp. FJAT-18017 TaxID=1705566 RepID=UPI0006B046A7|nr:FAD-dependent oxidoreductase [Bacillus sp. FJAT-18017]ALC92195.1 phytoene dehydrogenase [Bacillus sp. FJAT-18017]
MNKFEQPFDTVIVGGGLAGLSTAALLSKQGKKVLVLERGNLGGRAVTLKIKGFSFNFGSHAIYGRDVSILKKIEKELGLTIDWRDFSPTKAKYDLGDQLTDVPANIKGLFRTKLLSEAGKVKFAFEVLKTLTNVEKGHPHMSIGKWMETRGLDQEVKDMMLTLASSNFFTREPENIPSDVYFSYYNSLFKTSKPVSYIGGGWQALIDELVRVIKENGGIIQTKAKVDGVEVLGDRVNAVKLGEHTVTAEKFVFAIPPKELMKLFAGTKIEHAIQQYAQYNPTVVFVYDIGLKERIDVPYTYIYDTKNKVFVTDLSYYDEGCVPEGGQLLQATAYMNQSDLGNKEAIERFKQTIEQLYDKKFPGWRDQLVVPRISQRAVVQEIKCNMTQKGMPIYFMPIRNIFFCGDWCEGEGQLSELSFSSAYKVSELVLNSLATSAAVR